MLDTALTTPSSRRFSIWLPWLPQPLWIGFAAVLWTCSSNSAAVAADQDEWAETPSVTEDAAILYPFCTNGKWGYIDKCGRVVVESKFVAASPWNCVDEFHGGLARVHVDGRLELPNDGGPSWHGGIWYYINTEGFVVAVCHRDGESAGALGYWHHPH